MRVEFFEGGRFGYYGFDALGLHFLHDVNHVLGGVLEDREYRSVTNWSVGTQEHWVVSDDDVQFLGYYNSLK